MPTNSLSAASAALIAAAATLQADLEAAFDTAFHLWVDLDGWRDCTDSTERGSAGQLLRHRLQEHFPLTQAKVFPLDQNRCWVIVPVLNRQNLNGAFIGQVVRADTQLVERLAESVRRSCHQRNDLHKANQRLGEYAFQVTCDFEELTWLRDLAEHIEVCDVRNDIANVAQATLPSLRQLIGAEAICLYRASGPREGTSDEIGVGTLHFVDGTLAVSEQSLQQLVTSLQTAAIGRPVVRNAVRRDHSIPEQIGIQNCILIGITKGGTQFGWLLALNKQPLHADDGDNLAAASALSDWEFGTFEAGLMNAAAIMLATHARNVQLLQDKESLLTGVIRALINAIDAKDAYTFGHSDRVALMSKRIAQELGRPEGECEQIYMAGLLHDIGKIGVPDTVLGKPDRLTEEEFAIIKTHPVIGYSILKHLKQLSYVLPGVLHHHEMIDGNGYPHGLAGDAIPLHGRIIAVADAYDAMTSDRPYRKGMPREKAEAILRGGISKQWDARVIEAFFAAADDMHEICNMDLDHSQIIRPTPLIENSTSLDTISAAVAAVGSL